MQVTEHVRKKYPDRESLATFIDGRNRLIDLLETGALNKAQYLDAQCQAMEEQGMVPRKGPIKSIEEGLFNYQYYNIMAKKERVLCKDEEYRNPSKSRAHRGRADRFYELKDRETVKIIEFLGYKDVEAYYIETPAKYLVGKLIEIVILNHDRAVFHTADEGIYNRLVRAAVFTPGIRPSVIKAYIESDY